MAADIIAAEPMPAPTATAGPPGATVDELLAIGRAMNPALAASALEAEAAVARTGTVGRLPDPTFTTEFEDITGQGNRYVPDTLGRIKYTLAQTIPLWGKLGLERDVAFAEASAAAEERRATENDLAARIKTVFAGHYGTNEAIAINRELLDAVSAIALVAQSRYGQGLGDQADAVTAEVEKGRLQAELVRLDGERRMWVARTNALLDRPAGAPLAPPAGLPAFPVLDAAALAGLLERAQAANPELAARQAQIAAAASSADLVRRQWYPDLTLGLSVFDGKADEGREFGGYEAMVAFEIPLQWGVREAKEREAVTRLAASQARRNATSAELRSQLEEAVAGFEAARNGARILSEINIPQSKVVLRSALAGYQLGRAELPSVLLAEQAVLRVTLERIALLVEAETRLAAIERLVGGEL